MIRRIEIRSDCAVSEWNTNLKTKVGGDHAFLFQGVKDVIRIDRIARIAQASSLIAEADLIDAGADAKLKLVVHASRPPLFDAISVWRGPRTVSISDAR